MGRRRAGRATGLTRAAEKPNSRERKGVVRLFHTQKYKVMTKGEKVMETAFGSQKNNVVESKDGWLECR